MTGTLNLEDVLTLVRIVYFVLLAIQAALAIRRDLGSGSARNKKKNR